MIKKNFVGNKSLKENEIISVMKLNKFYLSENVCGKITIKHKLNIQNVVTFYQFAKIVNLPNLCETAFSYIERCFTMIVETDNFLELHYNYISNILASSKLLITSEVEVYNAASAWLSHDIKERNKFAKDLLLTVRLPLLSDPALRHLLNKSSPFTKIYENRSILENCLKDNKSSVHYTNRYCNQNNFNVLVLGGCLLSKMYEVVSNVTQVDVNNFKTLNVLPSMMEAREVCKAVCLKGEIYLFSGRGANNNWNISVEKYSPVTKHWNKVGEMLDNRVGCSVCVLMDKIFIIGGYYRENVTNSCLQFDAKSNNWKEVAGMNEARSNTAATVFEEKIVVSGGWSNINFEKFNTVEVYDIFANDWSSMSNMTKRRSNHEMVVVNDKLFVIGFENNSFEVFDKTCRRFIAFNSPEFSNYHQVITIGEKIYVFEQNSLLYCYDVNTDKWSKESCKAIDDLIGFTCVTLYSY